MTESKHTIPKLISDMLDENTSCREFAKANPIHDAISQSSESNSPTKSGLLSSVFNSVNINDVNNLTRKFAQPHINNIIQKITPYLVAHFILQIIIIILLAMILKKLII